MVALKPNESLLWVVYDNKSQSEITIPTSYADHFLLNRFFPETSHSCHSHPPPSSTTHQCPDRQLLFESVIASTQGHTGSEQCSITDILQNTEGTYDLDATSSGVEHLSLTFGSGSELCKEGTHTSIYNKVDEKVVPVLIHARFRRGRGERF